MVTNMKCAYEAEVHNGVLHFEPMVRQPKDRLMILEKNVNAIESAEHLIVREHQLHEVESLQKQNIRALKEFAKEVAKGEKQLKIPQELARRMKEILDRASSL